MSFGDRVCGAGEVVLCECCETFVKFGGYGAGGQFGELTDGHC